jgi:hypothetical protein
MKQWVILSLVEKKLLLLPLKMVAGGYNPQDFLFIFSFLRGSRIFKNYEKRKITTDDRADILTLYIFGL